MIFMTKAAYTDRVMSKERGTHTRTHRGAHTTHTQRHRHRHRKDTDRDT